MRFTKRDSSNNRDGQDAVAHNQTLMASAVCAMLEQYPKSCLLTRALSGFWTQRGGPPLVNFNALSRKRRSFGREIRVLSALHAGATALSDIQRIAAICHMSAALYRLCGWDERAESFWLSRDGTLANG